MTFFNILLGAGMNSLVLIAELSFLPVERHTGQSWPWQDHAPACRVGFRRGRLKRAA
jgi:hypothetical protein